MYQYIRAYASQHGPMGSPYYIGKGHGKRAYVKNRIEVRRPRDRSGIVILAKDLTEQEAFAMEILLIREHGRIDLGTGCLRNKTSGGDGASGAVRSIEIREKISAAKMGRKHTKAARANMASARLGKKHSAETKAKIGAAHTGRKNGPMSEAQKLKISLSTKGIKRSKEFGNRIAASNRRRSISQETRAKISASLTGKTHSLETREKMSKSHKERRANTL